MDMQPFGKIMIVSGAILLATGLFFHFGGKLPFSGLGHLPGDIRIERENFRFYFPVTSSILVSLIFSAIVYIFSRMR
jgi:hypothetical protein